eukprot:6864715-Lingulodinium_polyedra.AAC.1
MMPCRVQQFLNCMIGRTALQSHDAHCICARAECANRKTHCAAILKYATKYVCELLSRKSFSDMRPEMHLVAAAQRASRFTHFMRRRPCGSRRMEC